MGTISANAITPVSGSPIIPVKELETRVVQSYNSEYTGGEWNPDNNSNWVPGSFVDFTPQRADSRISYIWRCPHAWVAASHAISHWRFFVNGNLYFWHSTSGVHIEDGCTLKWDVPSWGTSNGRIGYQIRSYSNDNHEVRMYTTFYWDGTGRSAQNARGHLIVEEYVGASSPASIDGGIFTAK